MEQRGQPSNSPRSTTQHQSSSGASTKATRKTRIPSQLDTNKKNFPCDPDELSEKLDKLQISGVDDCLVWIQWPSEIAELGSSSLKTATLKAADQRGFLHWHYRGNSYTKKSERQVVLKYIDNDLINEAYWLNHLSFDRQRRGSPTMELIGITRDEMGKFMMVMEHADGGNLHEFLSNNPADTWRKIYNHAHNIAWALYEMHQLGVVHGDLHPKNVLFSRNIPHLVDVGLSTDARNPPASLRLDYCPHKHYMAPEEQTSTMSDVFSFGLILWFLITTVDPWSGLRKSRGSEEAGYFEIPGTPDEYQQIYMDCLRKDPKNRPSMETVYKRLRKLWKKPDDEAVKIPHEEIERIVRGQELDSDEESDDDEEAGETSSFDDQKLSSED